MAGEVGDGTGERTWKRSFGRLVYVYSLVHALKWLLAGLATAVSLVYELTSSHLVLFPVWVALGYLIGYPIGRWLSTKYETEEALLRRQEELSTQSGQPGHSSSAATWRASHRTSSVAPTGRH